MLAALQRVGVIERAQLALRMVTKLQPSQVRLDINIMPSSMDVAQWCYKWDGLDGMEISGWVEVRAPPVLIKGVSYLQPQVSSIVDALASPKSAVPAELEAVAKTFRLPVDKATDDEKLVSTTLALFFLRCLEVSDFTKAASGPGLSKDQLAVFTLLQRAILVALYHTK